MIISASYRTDIPAFYADWFQHRLAAGEVAVRNPYGGGVARISLAPRDVTAFVFWTRNAGPFLPALETVAGMDTPFMVQFTVTGYPRSLDAAVIPPGEAVEQIREIGRRYGCGRVVWRYDPIVFTDATGPEWHMRNFAALADRLAGSVDEVVFSVAHIYRKTRRGLTAAGQRHGFSWSDPTGAEKRALLARLGAAAAARGLAPRLCAQPDLLVPEMGEARCIDGARLSRLAATPLAAPEKGNRPGCRCVAAKDIGAYDTCPHGCVYCYAVRNKARAAQFAKSFDPAATAL